MKSVEILPDEITFVSLLNGYAELANQPKLKKTKEFYVEKAFYTFDQMQKLDIQTSTASFNALLKVCSQMGTIDDLAKAFNIYTRELDIISFTIAVQCCINNNCEFKVVNDYVQKMIDLNIVADHQFVAVMIKFILESSNLNKDSPEESKHRCLADCDKILTFFNHFDVECRLQVLMVCRNLGLYKEGLFRINLIDLKSETLGIQNAFKGMKILFLTNLRMFKESWKILDSADYIDESEACLALDLCRRTRNIKKALKIQEKYFEINNEKNFLLNNKIVNHFIHIYLNGENELIVKFLELVSKKVKEQIDEKLLLRLKERKINVF